MFQKKHLFCSRECEGKYGQTQVTSQMMWSVHALWLADYPVNAIMPASQINN